MKVRMSYSNVFEHEKEHGVYCPCGLCLFVDEKDLTPPETLIKCPECGFEVRYYTPAGEISDIVDGYTMKVVETEEEFIFRTIQPFCEQICERKISKEELIEALTYLRNKKKENELMNVN